MNETITNEALDLIVFADDCKCTDPHDIGYEITPECSVEVTSRVVWCAGEDMICHNLQRAYSKCIGEADGYCNDCGEDVSVCWKVIPV